MPPSPLAQSTGDYMRNVLLTIFISILLAACDSETTYDVEYYVSHDNERQQKLQECANNPGELADTPNCQNAAAALNKLATRKSRITW